MPWNTRTHRLIEACGLWPIYTSVSKCRRWCLCLLYSLWRLLHRSKRVTVRRVMQTIIGLLGCLVRLLCFCGWFPIKIRAGQRETSWGGLQICSDVHLYSTASPNDTHCKMWLNSWWEKSQPTHRSQLCSGTLARSGCCLQTVENNWNFSATVSSALHVTQWPNNYTRRFILEDLRI